MSSAKPTTPRTCAGAAADRAHAVESACRAIKVRQLEELLRKHKGAALAEEAKVVDLLKSDESAHDSYDQDELRLSRGVYFNHIGLARHALETEFGRLWREYLARANLRSLHVSDRI